jgi:hypothetical protein
VNFPLPSILLRLLTETRLVSAGAVCVICITLGLATPAQAEPKRNVVGYSSELSVRPGDTVEFHVNVVGAGTYEADLVRVVNGDSVSLYADHFQVDEVAAPYAGSHKGIEQPLNPGGVYEHADQQ